MTVASEINHNQYVGNGVTTSFDYQFRVFNASHLQVETNDLNGVITTLVLNTDYTVTGVGSVGGKVVLTAPLANGWGIDIARVMPVVQETDLRNQGTFYAETHEDAFDYLTMLIQKLNWWLDTLALKKPSILAKFYDAKGNRIANLSDPQNPQDAATKAYTDTADKSTNEKVDANFKRSLRVPEDSVNVLPTLQARQNSLLGFDTAGNPVPIFSFSAIADLAVKLASVIGGTLVGLAQGGKVQDALNWIVTPEMYGAVGDGVADDTVAVQTAINKATNKTLFLLRKYRTKNLTIPAAMTIRGNGRRQGSFLIPYGNVPAEGFIHTGNYVYITFNGTVTFYDFSADARDISQQFVDGQRLFGVVQADNADASNYQSGFQMYNCNVSGFSGNNIKGGANRSFGILKDLQSEKAGLSCVVINGLDWRVNSCYVGRSLEKHGFEIYGQSNAIINSDSYFNARDGIAYEVTGGAVLISVEGCVVNSNGQNGIRITGPYSQPAGTKVVMNKLFNNSTSSDGTYSNIILTYGRGHQVFGNIHFEYSTSASETGSPRCGFCLNLLGGATLSGPFTDAVDPLYSYRNGVMNVNTQSIMNQNGYLIGSGVDFTKGMSNDTRIAFSAKINTEGYDRVQIIAGGILFGNGSDSPTHGWRQMAAYPGTTMATRSMGVIGSYDDSVVRIGTHRLWSGGDGTIRTKVSAPLSATDGGILTERVDVPSSQGSSGSSKQWAANDNYLYVCVSANSWRRVALTTF